MVKRYHPSRFHPTRMLARGTNAALNCRWPTGFNLWIKPNQTSWGILRKSPLWSPSFSLSFAGGRTPINCYYFSRLVIQTPTQVKAVKLTSGCDASTTCIILLLRSKLSSRNEVVIHRLLKSSGSCWTGVAVKNRVININILWPLNQKQLIIMTTKRWVEKVHFSNDK